jgi:hypothetical protein
MGEDAASLQREHAMARGADFARDLDGGGFGDALDRTILEKFDEDVVAPLLVHQRRMRSACGQHVDHGLHLLIVDGDAVGDVFRLRPRGRDADGDKLAHVADLVAGQNWFGRMLEAAERGRRSNGFDVGELMRSENGALVRIGHVHVANAPVRHRAAHEGDFARAGKAEISDVLAAPAQKSVVLLAQNGSPDPLASHA